LNNFQNTLKNVERFFSLAAEAVAAQFTRKHENQAYMELIKHKQLFDLDDTGNHDDKDDEGSDESSHGSDTF
jgi:hypothetical protein